MRPMDTEIVNCECRMQTVIGGTIYWMQKQKWIGNCLIFAKQNCSQNCRIEKKNVYSRKQGNHKTNSTQPIQKYTERCRKMQNALNAHTQCRLQTHAHGTKCRMQTQYRWKS